MFCEMYAVRPGRERMLDTTRMKYDVMKQFIVVINDIEELLV